MAKLASNNNKALGPWTAVLTSPKLAYYDGIRRLYYPLIKPTSTLTWNGYIYSYDKSVGDTFGIALDNTKYVVPNKRVAVNYDIPAGTYSPSNFEYLIRSFISNNGSRTVKNSFSVVVNGQTYSVPAGRDIYYTVKYGGEARFVSFNGSPRGSTEFQSSFYDKGVYCTYWSYSQYQGDRYYQYNIKVNTGIKFS